MNSEKDDAVEKTVDGCSNASFQFYTSGGYVNYQSLQDGRLSLGWGKDQHLVNHPRGKVRVEFRSSGAGTFSSPSAEFTNNPEGMLAEDVSLELSKEETTPLIDKFLFYSAKVKGEGDYKASSQENALFLINDQLPVLKCDNIMPDTAEFDLDATSSDYLLFSQEIPVGRSGTVAPVVVSGGSTLSVVPVPFYEKDGKSRGALTISMDKQLLYYWVDKEVFVGCEWSFVEGDKFKQYYSEMRKLRIKGTPV